MKNNHKFLMVMLTVVFVVLGACDNSSEESNNQSQNDNLTQNTTQDSAETDSTEDASGTDNNKADTLDTDNNNANKTEGTSNNVSAKKEDPSTTYKASLKEEYLKKLNDTKKETEELDAADSSTYALKKVENDRWDMWDQLLNEIYGVLKKQLPSKEMEQLREEQRNWIKHRDDSALEASLKYKGGTQEHLEYVTVLANLTEERCYELVEDYMK